VEMFVPVFFQIWVFGRFAFIIEQRFLRRFIGYS
jgi:hypothetical protein